MSRIQTTRVYSEIDRAVKAGYTTISEQGSSRSGKTYNTVIWLVAYCLANPGTRLAVVRATLPALKGSVLLDFKEVIRKFGEWDDRRFNKSELIFTFGNGSWIEFFSCDNEQKLRGRKRDVLYANEANELKQIEWQQLKMRTTRFSIIDYNPSFSDDHWICSVNFDPRTYHFITTYKDNCFLEQTIVDEIESLRGKNQSLWRIYGLGLQAIVEGLIFTNMEVVEEIPPYVKKRWRGMDFGYACFKGDTLITTSRGQVPIREVKAGDYVLTRQGYHRVKKNIYNGYKQVIKKELYFGDKSITVEATAEHNFNSNGKWKKYGELTREDKLCVLSTSLAMSIKDTRQENTQSITTTNTSEKEYITQTSCITQYINTITEKFLKGKLYITRILTHLITSLKTLLRSLQVNIQKSICHFSNGMQTIPKRSIKESLVRRTGTQGEKKSSRSCPIVFGFANIAEILSDRPIRISDSVLNNVITGGNIPHPRITRNLPVNGVERSSWEINTSNLNVAAKIAPIEWRELSEIKQRKTEWCKVYDLEVEGVHEYFANGILVHNCDPTAIVDVYLYRDNLYIDEICYNTQMLSSDIIRVLKENDPTVETITESADPRLIQEIYRGGCNVKPVVKYPGSINAGIQKMLEYKICITKRSPNVIKEFKNYTWAQDKEGKFLNHPIDCYNHCFTGDTDIITISGNKHIDNITTNDYVLTSKGFRKVLKRWDNGVQKVNDYALRLRDGRTVIVSSTKEHLIKTDTGWKQIQELRRWDVIYLCRQSHSMEIVVLENITVSGSREENVYDLYVEGVHEYFANGILVHNCIDAARYVTLMKILGGVPRGVNLNKIASLAGR